MRHGLVTWGVGNNSAFGLRRPRHGLAAKQSPSVSHVEVCVSKRRLGIAREPVRVSGCQTSVAA